MSMSKGRMIITQGSLAKFFINFVLSSLSLFVKSVEKEIESYNDRVNITRSCTLE